MQTIWKFPLAVTDGVQTIEMPKNARIVHVDAQFGAPCLWASVDSNRPKQRRNFVIYGTGDEITAIGPYIGTVLIASFVWHIFETVN
jgi:hypothetical protein